MSYPLMVGIAVTAAFMAFTALLGMEGAVGVVAPLETTALLSGLIAACAGGYGWVIARREGSPFRLSAFCAVLGAIAVTLLISSTTLLYQVVPVRISSDGNVLVGDAYVPKSIVRVPGVVLVHGSGRQTRQELAFYAKFLARRGIAAIVYDKRGAGESTGNTYATDYAGYARDATAAFRTLSGIPQLNPQKIGFWGFSEAEWVVPLAVKNQPQAAFFVIVGPSGATPCEQVAEEIDLRLRRKGFDAVQRKEAAEFYNVLAKYQRSGEGGDALKQTLATAKGKTWFGAAEDFPPEVYRPEDYRWWRSVMDSDTRPLLPTMDVPMLFLKGSIDDRTDATETRRRLIAAVGNSRNKATIDLLSGADHAMLTWPFGASVPPPFFVKGYPNMVVHWILETTEKARSPH